MIQLQNLEKIHKADEYHTHGEALLSESSDYYEQYMNWLSENDPILKSQYIKLLIRNDEDVIDSSYLEWAMTSYVVYDYNTVKSEIENLLK